MRATQKDGINTAMENGRDNEGNQIQFFQRAMYQHCIMSMTILSETIEAVTTRKSIHAGR